MIKRMQMRFFYVKMIYNCLALEISMNEYFLNEMKNLLKDEYDAFLKTQDDEMYRGIRINPARTSIDELRQYFDIGEKTPFDENTYYLTSEEKLGTHPFHLGGLYYLQEPSATAAVNALSIQENDKVLDLCAAPGGKSTQILSALNQTGFLVSNEINAGRAETLAGNLERWGYDNYVVTSMETGQLCSQFEGYFDRILVDAPCSGASMFKKYPESVYDYTERNVLACSYRQLEILDNAYKALKEGGTLVYSTCTYNQTENENVVLQFLKNHQDCSLLDTGLKCGRKGIEFEDLDVSKLTRIFPMDGGEGHFICKMVKNSSSNTSKVRSIPFSHDKTVDDFIKKNMKTGVRYTLINDRIYASTGYLIDFKGRILRQGIPMGTIVKNRVEPHHGFFTAIMNENSFMNRHEADDSEINKFLLGESIPSGEKGYVQICYKGHPVGFGKGDGRQIKNHLPKGLRLKQRFN